MNRQQKGIWDANFENRTCEKCSKCQNNLNFIIKTMDNCIVELTTERQNFAEVKIQRGFFLEDLLSLSLSLSLSFSLSLSLSLSLAIHYSNDVT